MRGFEKVSITEYQKNRPGEEYPNIVLPKRSTVSSAGYDFTLPYDLILQPKESAVISTGIKVFMASDEVLLLIIRSSLGFRHGLRLKNQVGVIDSDYFNNPENEGHILVAIENTKDEAVFLKKNDRIVQGIFLRYLTATNEENIENRRIGGIGSTK